MCALALAEPGNGKVQYGGDHDGRPNQARSVIDAARHRKNHIDAQREAKCDHVVLAFLFGARGSSDIVVVLLAR